MAVQEILQLGNPKLYEASRKADESDKAEVVKVVADLHDTLMDFRRSHGFGRAIAAPQIGVRLRVVYMHLGEPLPMINPVLNPMGDDLIELWDDCMSFPGLLVKVRRHRRCRLTYWDLDGKRHSTILEDARSELLQHECDHLDGVLVVQRAFDSRSFAMRGWEGLAG